MKKSSEANVSIKKQQFRGIIMGIIMAYAITAISFIATALLLTYTNMNESAVSYIVLITCFIAVLVAGFDASKAADKNGWAWGMLAGAIYSLVLVCIIIWAQGAFVFEARKILLIILAIFGGGIGGIMGIQFK